MKEQFRNQSDDTVCGKRDILTAETAEYLKRNQAGERIIVTLDGKPKYELLSKSKEN